MVVDNVRAVRRADGSWNESYISHQKSGGSFGNSYLQQIIPANR